MPLLAILPFAIGKCRAIPMLLLLIHILVLKLVNSAPVLQHSSSGIDEFESTAQTQNVTVDIGDVCFDNWNISFSVNPKFLACHAQVNSRPTPKNKTIHVCSMNGGDCHDIEVPDWDSFDEEQDIKDKSERECDNVGEHAQIDTKGWIIVCYESHLDAAYDYGIKPPFQLNNIEGNSLAEYCRKRANANHLNSNKILHGFRINFYITRKKDIPSKLTFNAEMEFSFREESVPLNEISNELGRTVDLFLKFTKGITTVLEDGENNALLSGAMKKPSFHQGKQTFQNAASLWLTMLDIRPGANILIELSHLCDLITLSINDEIKPDECKIGWKAPKEIAEEKEVKKIMNKIDNIFEKCNYGIKPPVQVDPNIANPPNFKPPEELVDNDENIQMYDDVTYNLEEAERRLKDMCEECGFLGKEPDCTFSEERVKRQISDDLFLNYEDSDTYKWSPYTRWTLPIQYAYENRKDYVRIAKVQSALSIIQKMTCITFEYNSTLTFYTKDFGFFFFMFSCCDDGACYSPVGRGNNRRDIKIKHCDPPRIAHEILHSLGFHHEQLRIDRDGKVFIIMDKIQKKFRQFYNIEKTKTLGLPYDFGSIMHYGPRDFSIDRENYNTIVAKDRAFQQTIGRRTNLLSFKDYKALNLIYCQNKCPDGLVPKKENKCKWGGYKSPFNCEKCICPSGFFGDFCEYFPYKKECLGQNLVANNFAQKLVPASSDCMWKIETKDIKQKIIVTVQELINFNCNDPCHEDLFLEIHLDNDKTAQGARLCCASQLPYTFTTSEFSPVVTINFKATNSASSLTQAKLLNYPYFELTYETPDPMPEPGKAGEDALSHAGKDWIYQMYHCPSNIIVNNKYRIYTEGGRAEVSTNCVISTIEIERDGIHVATSDPFWVWENKQTNESVRVDDLICEDCYFGNC